ncbi:hypothetical protein KDA_49180 [Dictyobacter alpinus]|uniref:DUF998 domain-containing protein n=1 Tax=Dictyobacter alpinus TaxID=2014873 RepID=A0A402BDK2_9CHLR|nr:DUF998 domain-containing protein [Dictyobacter alpinus]GCE29434.1 hypothetical protein KDA_49180 [Dictyobacter alpinus]
MNDYRPTVRQDQPHPRTSAGTYQRDQGLSIATAILLIIAVFEYLVLEVITASAWKTPVYSYASNWISDLGVPDCSTFQGRQICSPLHNLMNTGFIVQGVLFLIASILLLWLFSKASRKVYLPLALIYSVGITLVGIFHGSTAATENGTVAFHFLGAFMAIPAGNTIAIVTGFQWRRLKTPRWFGRISIVLGFIGVVGVIVLFPTIGRIPSGIPERASVYTILLWQLLTGIVLLVACVNARGQRSRKH